MADTAPPDAVVQTEEVEKPVPKKNEVLIEVRVASVNALDGALMKGRPHIGRIMTGQRKPNRSAWPRRYTGYIATNGREAPNSWGTVACRD
jgi:NADPH:quinone reductase-like Zn-dependent oxidoreductase